MGGDQRQPATHPAPRQFSEGVAFSPNGRLLASGSWDKTVRLWDVTIGTLQHTLHHGNWVYAVAFSPDDRLLAAGTGGNRVVLWEVQLAS
jgi:WD40 repeat protein